MKLLCLLLLLVGAGLGHQGHHHHEAEHFHEDDHHEDHRHWYTKEANENLQESLKEAQSKESEGHKHGHEHDHDHGQDHHNHGHGHGHGHGHSHHGHGNSHHGHGHSHHGHEHSHHGHGHSHGDEHTHHGHSHEHHHGEGSAKKAQSSGNEKVQMQPMRYVWLESIISTCLISAAPFLILFFVPLENNSEEQRPLLKILLSFASGGLLGDAFLHLIPHAISPHSHSADGHHSHSHSHSHGHVHEGENAEHSHDHSADMIVGLWVLAGMIAFLIVEKFVRHVKGGHSHSHSHSHGDSKKLEKDNTKVVKSNSKEDGGEIRERKKENGDGKKVSKVPEKDEPIEEGIKVSGYLNLAADFTHNFTDGLAIGASYLVSRNVGLVTTLTILLHEVPHEIGDFAILVQSGCSKKKAMWLQLTTATGALAGTLCGLLAENIGNAASSGILPFTAGGFIYIATVSVIPELLEDANPKQSFKEVIALLVGVLLMVVIALFE